VKEEDPLNSTSSYRQKPDVALSTGHKRLKMTIGKALCDLTYPSSTTHTDPMVVPTRSELLVTDLLRHDNDINKKIQPRLNNSTITNNSMTASRLTDLVLPSPPVLTNNAIAVLEGRLTNEILLRQLQQQQQQQQHRPSYCHPHTVMKKKP
jgi:hypothetical protein